MRWASACDLVRVSVAAGPDGTPREERSSRRVPCNEMRAGATSWAAARSAGLHADARVRVRACDYLGEQACVLGGVEHEVEQALAEGEFCDLVLKRRLRSG